MNIIESSQISSALTREATETESPNIQVSIAQATLDVNIEGACVEACIQLKDEYLIFTTNDCPFEETLNIYLIDAENNVVDSASIYWMYSTGMLSDLTIKNPNTIGFTFFKDTPWNLEVFEKPQMMVPYISEPKGVFRKMKLKRRFRISEKQ